MVPLRAEAARIGLSNSVYAVRVELGDEVVGDGALFLEAVDIAVLPAHQKRELGAMIVDALMGWWHENARRAPSSA